MKQQYMLAGVALASAGVGGAAGYFLTRKHLETKFDEMLEQELDNAKEFYKAQIEDLEKKLDEKPIPESKVTIVNNTTPVEVVEDPVEPPAEDFTAYRNVASAYRKETVPVLENFNYEEELAARTPDRPYIISFEEFAEGRAEIEQASISYYEGDDVTCDEKDQTIDDVDALIGLENLQRFGHGSTDPNIVYVRNEYRGLEMEIIREPGKYSEVVLGFVEPEPKHKTRKFKVGDD